MGLAARQTTEGLFGNPFGSFQIDGILRYDGLKFTSGDGASTVDGFLNLSLTGAHFFERENMIDAVGVTVSVGASSNISSGGGQWQHSRSVFGVVNEGTGALEGYNGQGAINAGIPLRFSTTTPEKIEISLLVGVAASPGAFRTATAAADFLNTLSLNPDQLVTFTTGVNPTFSSLTGEIINNRLVIPEPGAWVLTGLGAMGLGLIRRRGWRGKAP